MERPLLVNKSGGDQGVVGALRKLTETLAQLGIPYFIGGSLASSIHGVFRATADVDIVASLRSGQIEEIAQALTPEFYADSEQMRDALARQRPFTVIHIPTAYKFDLFPLTSDPFHQSEFQRRVQGSVPQARPAMLLPFASAEDTILAKLAWYRRGGETSERQWTDISQVIEVQGQRLDWGYLKEWALYLKVGDLLHRLAP